MNDNRSLGLLPHALATLVLALYFLTMWAIMPARAAVDIQEITSDSGVTAWLVEDYAVPIVTIRFAFKGGSTQDPPGKAGLANLMTGLFDEGAGDLKSAAFQDRLDEVGADIDFSAGRDAIYGEMRVLAKDAAEAFELLRLAINEPRFDQEPLNRIRAQIATGIIADRRDPQEQAREAFAKALYGDHPYARPSEGTVESLASITPEDLHAFHERNFARSNLSVAIVGAIDAETAKKKIDRLFGELPEEADLRPVEEVSPELSLEFVYDYDLPQTSLQLVYPGIERDDPQFFAAYLMNHILGGGTFSSRLFEDLREQRGLTYGVGSWLSTRDYTESLIIGTSTRADQAQEALAVIEDVIRGVVEEGVTQEELKRAKDYVIGAYAINNLDSSVAIARTLVVLQKEDLGIDYIERREDVINAVTLDEVNAAADRLLTAEPAQMLIGPAPAEKG